MVLGSHRKHGRCCQLPPHINFLFFLPHNTDFILGKMCTANVCTLRVPLQPKVALRNDSGMYVICWGLQEMSIQIWIHPLSSSPPELGQPSQDREVERQTIYDKGGEVKSFKDPGTLMSSCSHHINSELPIPKLKKLPISFHKISPIHRRS